MTGNPEEEYAAMPVQIGPQRYALQLSAFLPSAHLTLVSVLQGVGLTALVGQLGAAAPEHFPNWLLYADSVLVIALAWFLYVAAFVAFQWPFNGLHATLQFVFAAAEVYAFSHVGHPQRWFYGLAIACFTGGVIRFLNTRFACEKMYVPGPVGLRLYKEDLQAERGGAALFTVIAFALALSGAVGASSSSVVGIIAAVILVLLIALLIVYDRIANRGLARALKGSPWELSAWGVVMPASNADRERSREDHTGPPRSEQQRS